MALSYSLWAIGNEGSNPSPRDWCECAQQSMADAVALLGIGSHQNAYMSAGMAVEYALKGYIMHKERLNAWPSRRSRPELHTHNLGRLLTTSGLRIAVELEILNVTDLGVAWMVVKDFDINGRYPHGKPFPVNLARDFVEAVSTMGLLQWLTSRIL